MGRVFSIEQIRDSAVHVPTIDDFESASKNFGNAIEEEIADGLVSGAQIFGSVAIGRQTRRSDFDCMIIPFEHTAASIKAIRRTLAATDPSGRIEVNAIPHPRHRLVSGSHEMDRFFGEHITGPARIVFGEDPATYITFPDYGAYNHLASYIRRKKRKVAEGLAAPDVEYHKNLQRILELPLAIGRKTLRALDEIRGGSQPLVDGSDKAGLVTPSLELFDSFGISETPQRIMELDKTYNKVLEGCLEGGTSEEKYSDVLTEIAEAGLAASEWLDRLDDGLRELVA